MRGSKQPARVRRHGRLAAALVLAGLAAGPVAGDTGGRHSLSALQEMAGAGAPGLALTLMDEYQPSVDNAPAAWARWEQTRIRILSGQQAWRRALDQLADLPAAAPTGFRPWALEQRAMLHLQLDEPAAARAVLRDLIWDGYGGDDAVALQRWQQLIIRSYLADGLIDDAVVALRRFDHDYPVGAPEWLALRARVLIQAGRPGEALARLPADTGGELLALRLLAQLEAGGQSPEEVREAAELAATAARPGSIDGARLLVVAARVASRQGAPARHALTMEQAIAAAAALPSTDTLFAVDGDSLWRAYLAWGERRGNELQLLLGDDDEWLAAVDDALPRYPVQARSLLAVLALRRSGEVSDRAHAWLVDLLTEGGPGMGVVRRLYLESRRFDNAAAIPTPVRYRLVDYALGRDDLELATRVMVDLPTAPADTDPFDWRLLRSRVLVLGGRADHGADALIELLDEHDSLDPERMDRLMQVIFDLQGARAHELALGLLDRIAERELPGQRRRELLYWQAESQEALGDHRRAAELYIASATLLDGRGGDPWGQTARYQAAGMLAEIGLVNDARRIYRLLLRVTEDPGRQAQLRSRLQQLGLREPGSGDLAIPGEPADE